VVTGFPETIYNRVQWHMLTIPMILLSLMIMTRSNGDGTIYKTAFRIAYRIPSAW
jgi:hypothetical protein